MRGLRGATLGGRKRMVVQKAKNRGRRVKWAVEGLERGRRGEKERRRKRGK